jgi:hypothetical protein
MLIGVCPLLVWLTATAVPIKEGIPKSGSSKQNHFIRFQTREDALDSTPRFSSVGKI